MSNENQLIDELVCLSEKLELPFEPLFNSLAICLGCRMDDDFVSKAAVVLPRLEELQSPHFDMMSDYVLNELQE